MLLHIVSGVTSEQTFTGRVAGWVVEQVQTRVDFEVAHVDLQMYDLPMRRGAGSGERDDVTDIARLGRDLGPAQAFIVLAGEHSHGCPETLRATMAETFAAWRRKPIAFVGWGSAEGVRGFDQLRHIATEHDMAPVSHAVHIPRTAVTAAGMSAADTSVFDQLSPRLHLLLDDLAWWARTLAVGRDGELALAPAPGMSF